MTPTETLVLPGVVTVILHRLAWQRWESEGKRVPAEIEAVSALIGTTLVFTAGAVASITEGTKQ